MSLEWQKTAEGLRPVLTDQSADRPNVVWAAQPGSQQAFLQCPYFECLYEGNRGLGKTDALLADFAQHVGQGFGLEWRGILFRQTYPQLKDVILKSKKMFHQIWTHAQAQYNEQKSCWTWATGESLQFAFIKSPDDYWNYHGHAYPWMGFEELTTWATSACYTVMFSCVRTTHPKVPTKVRSTTNPYGAGHNWVKARFGLPAPPTKLLTIPQGSPPRIAVHGSLLENRVLLHADPEYPDRIRAAARNPAQAKAWIEGSWDITSGGMFDDLWDPMYHVIPPFQIPPNWRIDRSFDWGSSAPFSVGWWAQSDGSDYLAPDGRWHSSVRGDLFRIHEWYGWDGNAESPKGIQALAVDVAQGIVEREQKMFPSEPTRVKPGPADSAIFNVENGVSIAQDMAHRILLPNGTRSRGVIWVPADKRPGSRKTGWEMMRKRLAHSLPYDHKDPKRTILSRPREKPGLFIFSTCTQFIRTIPSLPRSENDPDDVDTEAEDHIADETRYRIRMDGRQITQGTTEGMH